MHNTSRRPEHHHSSRPGRRSFLFGALATAAAATAGGVASGVGAAPVAAAEPVSPDAVPTLTVVVASSAHPTVAAALAAVPDGGTLVVDRSESVAAPLVVDRPTTVVFGPSVVLTATADCTVFDVRSSDVRIVDATLVGTGAGRTGAGRGIVVTGTGATPVERVSVEDSHFSSFSHTALLATNVVGLEVVACTISDVGYAGVLLVSCSDSVVRGCTITDVRQPPGYVNAYGIAVTRDESRSLTESPRSVRVTVDGNTVRGVPRWEGIDTHAGESIVIRGNDVSGCAVGIAVVPCQNAATPQEYVYAPTDVVVTGNHVERGASTGTGSGIVIKGAGSTVASASERATAVVEGNVVVGMGGGDREAGILLYLTRDVVVRGNTLSGCVTRGLSLYHSNDATLVVGNTVEGLALGTGASIAAAFEVRSASNIATFVGNAYRVSSGSGPVSTPVPVRGVSVPGSGNVLDLVRNDWSATTLPVYGRASTITRFADGP